MPPGSAGLVVPDVERAVGRLVHAVDRAAQGKGGAAADVDGDGLPARDRGPRLDAREPERHFEPAGCDFPAVRLFDREQGAAGDEDVVAPLTERELARGWHLLSPDLDLRGGDLLEDRGVPRRLGLLAGARNLLEEETEDLVEERARSHRIEPLGRVALELLRRLDAQHVAQEVLERALGEGFEPRRRLRLAARAGIQLRGSRAEPSVPDREVVGLPSFFRAPPVGEMGIDLQDTRSCAPAEAAGPAASRRESHQSVSSSAERIPGTKPAASGRAASSAE